MADTDQAVEFVLHQEDSKLSGEITTLPGDSGGATRFGVASASHPELVDEGFYKEADGEPVIPNDQALAIAEKVYTDDYATPIHLAGIENQDVANRMLSFAVNEGPREAVAIAQKALNSLGYWLAVDGQLGEHTLLAINTCNPEALISAIRAFQVQFYKNLVAARPAMLPLLQGLINRANA